MTEAPKPVFKAPNIPSKGMAAPTAAPSPNGTKTAAPSIPAYEKTLSQPAAVSPDKGLYDDNFAAQLGLPPSFLQTKIMAAILVIVLLVGMMLGCSMSGDSGKTRTQGLTGVVLNPEVPANRQRCGIAERTQGCVLYLQNPSRRDREARDFYQEASRMTGVASYTIELGNIEYATSIIRPGWIAQINIPPTGAR